MNITALLAGLLSGIAAAMGLGGGAVLIIYLNLFTSTKPLKAGGINLLFFVPIALLAVTVYAFKGQIKWKTVITLSLFGLLGAAVGFGLAGLIGGKLLSRIFGGLLIFMGLKETFSKGIEKGEK